MSERTRGEVEYSPLGAASPEDAGVAARSAAGAAAVWVQPTAETLRLRAADKEVRSLLLPSVSLRAGSIGVHSLYRGVGDCSVSRVAQCRAVNVRFAGTSRPRQHPSRAERARGR